MVDATVCRSDHDLCSSTNASGEFLLAGIPLQSWDGDTIDLEIASPAGRMPISRLLVEPGSILAPHLEIRFVPESRVQASDLLPRPGLARPPNSTTPAAKRMAATSSVFATREGLVGFSTANGHTIQLNDHFAALPSRRALNRSDAASDLEFEVEVTYRAKTARLPVWDVGPWNIKDDWWNPSPFRQTLLDTAAGELPQGTPLAQAAYVDGYHQGMDERGRAITNPAGIDLADGAFWDDLALVDNAYVGVVALWRLEASAGSSVRSRHWAKVRAGAGGAVIDSVDCGQTGSVLAGPDSATVSGHWYLFYKVEWQDGTVGWSAENFLTSGDQVSCADEVRTNPRRRIGRIAGGQVRFEAIGSTSTEIVVFDLAGRMLSRSGPLPNSGSWVLPESAGVQIVEIRSGNHRQILTRAP